MHTRILSAAHQRSVLVVIFLLSILVGGTGAASGATLDIDGNGTTEPATDGTLILRYQFGFRGPSLISGAIGSGATRTTADAIETYLASLGPALDIDGNGSVDPLTDGLLTLRYMSGYSGPELTAGALGTGAARNTPEAVQAYLATLGGAQVFASGLAFSPNTIFRSESTTVTVAIAVAFLTGTATLDLITTDESGVGTVKALTLYDDGDLAKGDDIAHDGVFHNKLALTPADSLDKFYVAKDPSSGQRSPVSRLPVAARLTSTALSQTLTFNTSVDTLVKNGLLAGKTWPQVRTDALALLAANPGEVKVSGLSDDGDGIWWVSKDELLIIVQSSTYGSSPLKAGGQQPAPTRENGRAPALPEGGNVQPEFYPGGGLHSASLPLSSLADGTIVTGSNRALVLAPYRTYFEAHGGDESNEVAQKLVDAGFDVTFNQDAGVTVDNFKNLSDYGVVVVSSHGDNYYKGLLTLWKTTFGESIPFWAESSSQVIVLTGVALTTTNRTSYETDLKTQRLVLTAGNTLAITPSFIKTYAGNLPDALVYMSSCRSTFNTTMADAFLARGAKTYLGYSNYVAASFGNSHGMSTFQQLIDGKTTGELTGIGDVDPSQQAQYQRLGATNLAIIGGLRNGTFEIGNLGGWSREGDTRIITQLGPLTPPQGAYMSIISTGLGSVTDSQSRIYQRFKMPANATRLKLRYNVISEEPLEYVGSEFDDKFEVAITPVGGTRQILRMETINTSTWIPIAGVDFAGGDSTVFQTGFKDVDVDVTSLRGQIVTFEVKVYDTGDSLYDTAGVVDNIRIETTSASSTSDDVAGAATATQTVSLSPASGTLQPIVPVALDLNYTTANPADPTLTGLGVRVHFNSQRVTFTGLSNVLTTALVGQIGAQPDTTNADNDSSTDSFVFIAWADVAGNWPGSESIRLATANFVTAPTVSGTAVFKATALSTAAGYGFSRISSLLSAPFTDASLVVASSVIRAVHVLELRARIDSLRSRLNLAAFSWTDPTIVAGVTTPKAQHLIDLRSALTGAFQAAGIPTPAFTDVPPQAAVTRIRAIHVTELRAAVLALEGATLDSSSASTIAK